MNTFERELKKIFTDCSSISNPTFVGSACYGDLGADLRAKIQFITMGRADYYEALRIMVINRTEGQVDTVVMRFSDLLGKKRTASFPEGISPHLWKYRDEVKWYAWCPSPADYAKIREAAASYLDVFRQPLSEMLRTSAKQKKPMKTKEQAR